MRTERATITPFSGGSRSEESFAMSMAIFAAPYAAFQTDSLDDPGSLGAISVGSQDGEAIDRAMALDRAASALRSLFLGWNFASSCLMYSAMGGAGMGGGLFVGVVEGLFRKFGMVIVGTTKCKRPHLYLDKCESRLLMLILDFCVKCRQTDNELSSQHPLVTVQPRKWHTVKGRIRQSTHSGSRAFYL